MHECDDWHDGECSTHDRLATYIPTDEEWDAEHPEILAAQYAGNIRGEWVPINARTQTCLHCDATRTIPDDCSGEHEGCGIGPLTYHKWHDCTGDGPRY